MTQVCDHRSLSYLTHHQTPLTAKRPSKIHKLRAEQPHPASHGTLWQGIADCQLHNQEFFSVKSTTLSFPQCCKVLSTTIFMCSIITCQLQTNNWNKSSICSFTATIGQAVWLDLCTVLDYIDFSECNYNKAYYTRHSNQIKKQEQQLQEQLWEEKRKLYNTMSISMDLKGYLKGQIKKSYHSSISLVCLSIQIITLPC